MEFKRIVDASKKNSLTFFVGAGVSALSNAPTWRALIDAICHEMGIAPKQSYSADDYPQIPQMFYYSIGQNNNKYYDFIGENLSPFSLVPNVVHKELISLNPSSFITTNFDELLEDATIQYCQSYKSVACDNEVPGINGDRFILKVHGDIRHKNIVFKEEDYLNYSENFKLIETLLKSIFSTNTVVFIGYGINDYNIKLILNWTKTLLKDNFNKPIFIYTDNEPLTAENLLYQTSKGLCVIEYEKLGEHYDEYLPRYLSVINAIKKSADLTYDGKTDIEAFDVTYELLKPLDKLPALRISDINDMLSLYLLVSSDGTISPGQKEFLALKYFFELGRLSSDEFDALPETIKEKYQLILNIFLKSQIRAVERKNKLSDTFREDVFAPFADPICLSFNYKEMFLFAKKKYKDMQSNYKKAFYLSRIYKYDEAFFLFTQTANEAFKSREYILYFFAETNRINLYKIIKNIHRYYRCYDLDLIESLSPGDDAEQIFTKLPIEFQRQYRSLRDLHSVNMLYKYSYDAFLDVEKWKNVIESKTVEFGLTSSDKVIRRIIEPLHFFLGNHLVVEEFSEYKNTIKNLVSLLVYKYSTQEEKTLREQMFSDVDNDIIFLDERDFYCFIEFFEAKELVKLFRKHRVETLVFHNIDKIELAVCNILEYYELALKQASSNIGVLRLQHKIKTCLTLLRYIDISQSLVDKICIFIFKYDFRDLLIDDKILFLNRQLIKRCKYSSITKKTIENKLIWFIDSHIAALETHKQFDCPSANSTINYCNLVHYIAPKDRHYHSRKLALRISKILENDLSVFFPQIIEHYWAYTSTYQQRKIISWAKEKLAMNFRLDLFRLLIEYKKKIEIDIILSLKTHLNKIIESNLRTVHNSNVIVYPRKDPYEDLVNVGYWCLIEALPKNFPEFVGYCDEFDFYYLYEDFDFNKFQPSWLLNLTPDTLSHIAKNENVRKTIRIILANTLNNDNLEAQDRNRLGDILTRHFCQ